MQITYPLTIWRSQLVSSWYRMSVASPRKRGRGGWSSCKRQFASRTRWLSCNWDKTRPRTAVTTRRKSTNLMRGQKRGDKHWNDVGEWLSLASKELRIDDTALVAHNKVKRTRSLTTRKRGQGQLLHKGWHSTSHKEAKRSPMNPTNSNLYIESSCSFRVDPFLTAIE